jgi:hypothetical protein
VRSIAILALLASLQAISIAQQSAPVTVTISTPTPTAKIGAQISIDVSVLNKSNQTVRILKALGADGQAEFVDHVQVYDADGKPLAWIAGRHSALSRRAIPVEPGKSSVDFLILTNLFDLSKPGTYTVRVRHELLQLDAPKPEDKRMFVPSNTLTITVTE